MKSIATAVLTFLVHQFIGMFGIPFTAPVVCSLGFKLLLLFGHTYPRRTLSSMVTELPYFPVQVVFALILGWLLGRAFRHRTMVWVWVIPLAVLCYALVTAIVVMPTSVFQPPF